MVAPALLLLLLVLCYRFTSACKKKDSSVRQGGGDEWGRNGEVIWREKEKKKQNKTVCRPNLFSSDHLLNYFPCSLSALFQ